MMKFAKMRSAFELPTYMVKHGYSTFPTSKPRNFNSLREEIYIMTLTMKLIEEETRCQKSVVVVIIIS